jgi:hypothetical protein
MAVPTDRTTRHPEPSTAALCKPHKSVRVFISITVGNISPDHQVGVVSRSQGTNSTSPLEMFLPCWEQSRIVHQEQSGYLWRRRLVRTDY